MLSAFNDTQKELLRDFHRGILSYYASSYLNRNLTDENFIETERLLKKQDIWIDKVKICENELRELDMCPKVKYLLDNCNPRCER